MSLNSGHLLHFTGRTAATDDAAFTVLESICKSSILRLSTCPIFGKETFEQKYMMVCFTDPEKVDLSAHTEAFGRFAVGFKKEPLMQYGANPVLYITPQIYGSIEKHLSLLAKLSDLNKDRDWKAAHEPYQFTEEELFALIKITGLTQEYSYRADPARLNYDQAEWRLLWCACTQVWDGEKHRPGTVAPSSINKKAIGLLKFAASDIDYIVTPKEFEERGVNLAQSISARWKSLESLVADHRGSAA